MSAVFVSFVESDRDIAESLARALDDVGVEVRRAAGILVAEDGRPAPSPFEPDEILAAVVIWTPRSVTDSAVRERAVRALSAGKLVNLLAGIGAAPFPFHLAQNLELDEGFGPLRDAMRLRLAGSASGPETVGDDPLAWLRRERLAVAATVPLGRGPASEPMSLAAGVSVADRPRPRRPAPMPAEAAADGAPPQPPAPAAAPPDSRTRRGSQKTALAGGAAAAALGAMVVGSNLLLGPLAHRPVGPTAVETSAPAATAPSAAPAPAPARAMVGRWAKRGQDCRRAAVLALDAEQLTFKRPDERAETGKLVGVDEDGRVTVLTGAGPVRYSLAGDTLNRTTPAGSATFERCPAGDAANVATVTGGAALIGMTVAGAPGTPSDPSATPTDEVDVSAFAPQELRAGQSTLVQIYLHPVDQAEIAAERAHAADPQTTARGQTTLDLDLRRGARVDVMLDAGGLDVDERVRAVVWRGRPCVCQFVISAAEGLSAAPHTVTAQLLVSGAPIGRLAFTLTVVAAAEPTDARPGLRGEVAKRYEQAFLSYSSLDRPEVLKSAQALHAAGIGYFQDILSIEPGEQWRERLFAEIDRCDLFLLFWSSHAAASDWVREEIEYALKRRGASGGLTPDITPIIIEGPPMPPPPPSLASLHFNDMLRYVVVASELEARARSTPSG